MLNNKSYFFNGKIFSLFSFTIQFTFYIHLFFYLLIKILTAFWRLYSYKSDEAIKSFTHPALT